MLFWIFIILVIVGIIVRNISYDLEFIGDIITLFSAIAVAMSLFVIIGQHVTVESNLEANREIYRAITYKIESDSCRDEFGLLNKEVIDEIQEWNKDVRYYQNIQENFWVGIYYPNVFDEFETIDYEKFDSR